MKIIKNKIDVVFLCPILIRYDIFLSEVMTCHNILTLCSLVVIWYYLTYLVLFTKPPLFTIPSKFEVNSKTKLHIEIIVVSTIYV